MASPRGQGGPRLSDSVVNTGAVRVQTCYLCTRSSPAFPSVRPSLVLWVSLMRIGQTHTVLVNTDDLGVRRGRFASRPCHRDSTPPRGPGPRQRSTVLTACLCCLPHARPAGHRSKVDCLPLTDSHTRLWIVRTPTGYLRSDPTWYCRWNISKSDLSQCSTHKTGNTPTFGSGQALCNWVCS